MSPLQTCLLLLVAVLSTTTTTVRCQTGENDEPLIDDIHTATATSTTTTSAPQNTAAAAEIPVAAPPDATMTRCVRCICLSTSACDASVCDPTAALCNLWEINYTEWRDAGAPVLPDREYPNPISAFEHCRSDEGCATETIVRYFDVTKADCNADGILDCRDVYILHVGGPAGCKHWPTAAVNKTAQLAGIMECMAKGATLLAVDEATSPQAATATQPTASPATVPQAPAVRTTTERRLIEESNIASVEEQEVEEEEQNVDDDDEPLVFE